MQLSELSCSQTDTQAYINHRIIRCVVGIITRLHYAVECGRVRGCVGVITENMKFHQRDRETRRWYLGPRSSHPDEAADVVDAGRARTEVGGPRRRADGRRRDAIQPINLVLDVADDRTNDEARALAFLPLADEPAEPRRPHAVTTATVSAAAASTSQHTDSPFYVSQHRADIITQPTSYSALACSVRAVNSYAK